MEKGLYSLLLTARQKNSTAVLVLENQVLRGGDATIFYAGIYSSLNGRFSATFDAAPHTTPATSIWGFLRAQVRLEGTIDGDRIAGSGKIAESPGLNIRFELRRIQDGTPPGVEGRRPDGQKRSLATANS
jgi:hypothetical protein